MYKPTYQGNPDYPMATTLCISFPPVHASNAPVAAPRYSFYITLNNAFIFCTSSFLSCFILKYCMQVSETSAVDDDMR
jgi:hypothetical protein